MQDKPKFIPARELESVTYHCGICGTDNVVDTTYMIDDIHPNSCEHCKRDEYFTLRGVTLKAKPGAEAEEKKPEDQPKQEGKVVKCSDCMYYKPLTGINGICARPNNEDPDADPIPITQPKEDRVCFWHISKGVLNGNWVDVLTQAREQAQRTKDIACEMGNMELARTMHQVIQNLDDAIGGWQHAADSLQALTAQDGC